MRWKLYPRDLHTPFIALFQCQTTAFLRFVHEAQRPYTNCMQFDEIIDAFNNLKVKACMNMPTQSCFFHLSNAAYVVCLFGSILEILVIVIRPCLHMQECDVHVQPLIDVDTHWCLTWFATIRKLNSFIKNKSDTVSLTMSCTVIYI